MKHWRCSYNILCPDREFKQTLDISAEDEHRADLKARRVMRKLFRAAGIVIRKTSIRRDLKAEASNWDSTAATAKEVTIVTAGGRPRSGVK